MGGRKYWVVIIVELAIGWLWKMIQAAWEWLDNLPLWADWLVLLTLIGIAIQAAWPEIMQLLHRWSKPKAAAPQREHISVEAQDVPDTVDYIDAWAIIDDYIAPATQGMRDIHRIAVRKEIMGRFDRVTGAKLGEYEYNHALLHQWMQSNAARFLVENRSKML